MLQPLIRKLILKEIYYTTQNKILKLLMLLYHKEGNIQKADWKGIYLAKQMLILYTSYLPIDHNEDCKTSHQKSFYFPFSNSTYKDRKNNAFVACTI